MSIARVRRAAVNASSARGATVPAVVFSSRWSRIHSLPFHHDACAQQAAINYIYDDLNRLVAAVDQQGNVARRYTYDLVGNLLKSIGSMPRVSRTQSRSRSSAPTGRRRSDRSDLRQGLSAQPPARTPVASRHARHRYRRCANRLLTAGSSRSTSGPIAVTAPLGSAASPTAFRVVGPIAISPPGAVLLVNSTQQFSVSRIGNPGAKASPERERRLGGYATIGTVSPTGLYSAHGKCPSPAGVTLIATETTTLPQRGRKRSGSGRRRVRLRRYQSA